MLTKNAINKEKGPRPKKSHNTIQHKNTKSESSSISIQVIADEEIVP